MFPTFQAYSNKKKELIGFISSDAEKTKEFYFITVDSKTEKIIGEIHYDAKDIQIFIEGFSKISSKIFKAIIVDLFDLNLESTPFKETSMDEICQDLKEEINKTKIPSYFISRKNFEYTTLLIAKQIEVSHGEIVVIILPRKNAFTVAAFKFTPSGYEMVSHKILDINFKTKPAILRRQILGTLNPAKIIFAASACRKKFPYAKVLKGLNYVVFECCMECSRGKVIVEICKWILDKTVTKYHIIPTNIRDVKLYGYYGTEKNILDILHVKMDEKLPITKTAICPKSFLEFANIYKFDHGIATKSEALPTKCHRYKISLFIDEDNFCRIRIDFIGIEDSDALLSYFDAHLKSKIPIIGFFDNSSVIAVQKADKGGYKFLDEWNGLFGNDLFVSFNQKKPQFGQAAKDALRTRNTFVVFDLLKIMSMPAEDIKAEKQWGFWFTKDAENPVLIEFNTFAGCKKAASPSFLMAMLLRQHLKVIKAIENGKNPTKIGLCILQEFDDDEMARIKEGLGKACELLKIEHVFVEVDSSHFV